VAETLDPGILDSSQDYVIVPNMPSHLQLYSYSIEDRYSRTWGPVCRRMFNGWDAALYRFSTRFSDRFYDFGIEDARRVMILGALTFNRDFDGACLGLGWGWDPPADASAKFEGRAWAWSKISGGFGHEESLLQYMEKAAECWHAHEPNQELAELLRKNEHGVRSAEIIGPVVAGVNARVSSIVGDLRETGANLLRKSQQASRSADIIDPIISGVTERVSRIVSDLRSSNSPQERRARPDQRKRRRGRPPAGDPHEDAQIAAAWATRAHKKLEDLASAFNMKKADVVKALDRHRHRSRDNGD
jgi:hypothetical protein